MMRHPVFKFLAIYLAVALVALAPIASMQRAAQAMGIKGMLTAGLVGGAALLALGALAGPAGAIGAAGCAGTGFLSTMGGAIGAAVSGITGICIATGTLAAASLATIGLALGGAFLAVAGLGLTPWVILPALALGGGLMTYAWYKTTYRTGSQYDQRSDRPFNDPFWDGGQRMANRSESGVPDNNSGGFFDSARSVFDRDRRDDSFFYTNRYLDSRGYVRQGSDFFARMDQFFNGRNSGYSSSAYGTYGAVPTDRFGRVIGQGSTPTSRTNLAPYAASDTPEETNSSDEDDLAAAIEARQEAYKQLISSIQEQKENTEPSAVGQSSLQSTEVRQAISDYKSADLQVKEITGRLQAREKQ